MDENSKDSTEASDRGLNEPNSTLGEDIEELLDSALDDMSRPRTVDNSAGMEGNQEPSEGWSEEFIKNATVQFENMLRTYVATPGSTQPGDGELDPVISQQFSQFASMAVKFAEPSNNSGQPASVGQSQSEKDVNQQDPLAETIRQLSQGAQSLKDMSEEEMLSKMLGDLGFAPDSNPSEASSGLLGGLDSVLPMMEHMMRGLVSRDVLYPPLKELCSKYPDWLAKNQPLLAAEQYAAFEKQFQLMGEVCSEFESELESDSEERKGERFTKLMEFMQKIQACGPPPTELTGGNAMFEGDATADVTFDPSQVGAPEQCCIM